MFGQKFGIEIESEGCLPVTLSNRLGRDLIFLEKFNPNFSGHRWNDRYYTKDGTFYIHLKEDGSLHCGTEVATSPMMEEHIPNLKIVLGALIRADMHPGHKAGLHVHVGISDLRRREWLFNETHRETLYKNWMTVLPKVMRSMAPTRERRGYCKPTFSFRSMIGDRYQAINASYQSHRTIEFRFWDTHLDYRYICRAVRFACGMFVLAQEDIFIPPIGKGESVESVMNRIVAEAHSSCTPSPVGA